MKYSIIIIAGSFVLGVLVLGLNLSFGLLFSEILDYFDEGKGDTAWIASLNTGIMYISGPVVSIITNKIGYRWAAVLGSVLTAAGMAISAFVNSMFYLYLTYGVIAGFGFGIGNFVRVAIVNLYFDKRRSLAMGITTSGIAIGLVLFPLLIEKCLKYYGWRGTFLILSGLCLQGVIFGALFRSPKSEISANTQNKKNCSDLYNQEEMRNKNINRIKEMYKTQRITLSFFNQYLFLLKKPDFCMLVLSAAVIVMALQLPFVMLPDSMTDKGMTTEQTAIVVTTSGIFAIFGRFVIGFLSDRRTVNRFILYGLVVIAVGGATIPCGFMESFPVFIGYAALFGIFSASCAVMLPVLLVDVGGKENIGPALAFMYFLIGILGIIGTPIGGWISDWTGSYNGTFYFAGAVYVCGGIILCCIPVYQNCKTKTYKMNMDIFHVTVF